MQLLISGAGARPMLVRLNDGADGTATLLGAVAERTGLRRTELRLTFGGK